MVLTKEQTFNFLEESFKEFNPAWNFLISAIRKIAEEYHDKQENKCLVSITEEEHEKYQSELLVSIAIIRDVLNDVYIKCHLIFLKDMTLSVSFGR